MGGVNSRWLRKWRHVPESGVYGREEQNMGAKTNLWARIPEHVPQIKSIGPWMETCTGK